MDERDGARESGGIERQAEWRDISSKSLIKV